jgi:hypothetical protein
MQLKKVVYVVRKLLKVSGLPPLEGCNMLQLFLDKVEDLRHSVRRRGLIKCYILFKVPAKGEDSYRMLLDKVQVAAEKHLRKGEGGVKDEDEGVVAMVNPPTLLRKITVKDMDGFLEWCIKEEPLPYLRHQLDAMAVDEGSGGSRFMWIDDDEFWRPEYENVMAVMEEAIHEQNVVKIRGFVNGLCFECLPYNLDNQILVKMSEAFVMICVMLFALEDDAGECMEVVLRGMRVVIEVCKWAKGQHDELVHECIGKMVGGLMVPKIERTLMANHKTVRRETYGLAMEFCRALKDGETVPLQSLNGFTKGLRVADTDL